MQKVFRLCRCFAGVFAAAFALQAEGPPPTALIHGRWFDGRSFKEQTVYCVDGMFTRRKPPRVTETLDLTGTWIVPPYAEAHNHNIDGVAEERSRRAIDRYLADGVLYAKIQGNFPLNDEMRRRLPINRRDGVDVSFAQTFLTASGGHPIFLHENILMPLGYYAGVAKESLQDKLYFTIDSEAELEKKWPLILALRPDFIKTNLWCSDEFEKRKNDSSYVGRRALDPRLLPNIVRKARASGLRVSSHVTNAADFHHAAAAGVDQIVHVPGMGMFRAIEERVYELARTPADPDVIRQVADAIRKSETAGAPYAPISRADARLAAKRGAVVVTTVGLTARWPDALRRLVEPAQSAMLRLLDENGVTLAIGSDNVMDSSAQEAANLQGRGIFDNSTLLRMWTETTARSIFPGRKIGKLQEGYEASFLALEGDPLADWRNVGRIKIRFKQGVVLPARERRQVAR